MTGPHGADWHSGLVQEAVRRIVETAHPLRIILFGSAARGEMTEDSDLDFLVVCPTPLDPAGMTDRIYEGLLGVDFPVDVIVTTEASLARYREDPGMIYWTALEEGREVYPAPT